MTKNVGGSDGGGETLDRGLGQGRGRPDVTWGGYGGEGGGRREKKKLRK